MAIGNEEELFSEASGELQTEVEDALESARETSERGHLFSVLAITELAFQNLYS